MSIVVIPHQPISFDYRLDNCSNLSDQCVHFELSDTTMFQVTNSADGCGVLAFIRATGDTVFDTISVPNEFISVSGTFVTVTLDFTSLGLSEGCYEIALYNVCTNSLTNLITNGTFSDGSTGFYNVDSIVISIDAYSNETILGNDGSVTLSATGGTGPYMWSIDGINYQVSSIFTGLTAGNYTITVKDSNNIYESITHVVVVNIDCSIYAGSDANDLILINAANLKDCEANDFI